MASVEATGQKRVAEEALTRPDTVNDPRNYRSIAYTRYDASAAPDYKKFALAYARRLSGKLAIHADWRCLDLACGYGNFLSYLRLCGVLDFLGVDSAETAVVVGKREFGNEHVVATDVFGFLRSVERPYRLVSALDFIEHLHKSELFEFLSLVQHVLEPRGFLLLRLPNAGTPFGMAAHYNDITHEICFTSNSIQDVLARAGLHTRQVWEDTASPRNPKQLVHWIAWQTVRLVCRVANAAETGDWGDGVLTRNMWVLAQKPANP